jgi:FKBP-type peptidyl-prolyl cis-trans isomerase SlpA
MTDNAPDRVGPEREITLHFTVSLMDGTVMDSTRDKRPATFVWGDGSLLPGFERAILGLKPGDRRSVFIDAENGFGPRNPDNVQSFRDHTFSPDLELKPGVVVNFADASGAELPGVITGHEDGWVTVDFNHPLAGRDLTFEVEIIDVSPYSPEQAVQIH